jgi:flavodoxin
MNTVVVYDSTFDNTEQLVRTITKTLAEGGQVRTVQVQHTHPLGLRGVDLLILGCPTQKWGPPRAMRFLLEYISPRTLPGLAIACFDTRLDLPRWMTGSAAEVMTGELRKMGVANLVHPESFVVKGMRGPLKSGELERAVTWAKSLREQIEARQLAMDRGQKSTV